MPKAEFLPAETDDIVDVFETIVEGPGGEKTTQSRKLDDIIGDLNDDSDEAELRVYKQSALGGKSSMSFVDSFPADKYSLSELQVYLKKRYGGGEFRVHVRVGGKLRANKLLSIEGEISTPQTTGLAGEGELSQILRVITEQNNRMIEAVTHQEQKDPMEEMTRMFQMMTMMREAMGITNQAPVNPLAQVKDTLDVLGEFGVTINGQPEKEEDGFSGLIEKMAPLVTAAASQPQPQPQPQPRPNPSPRPSQRGADPMIIAGVKMLLKAAAKNADPAFYAEMIMEQLPEDKIREFITDSKAGEKLVKLVPQVAHHAQWFDTLAEHVKAMLGLESSVSDLYVDAEDVINAETSTETSTNASGNTTKV